VRAGRQGDGEADFVLLHPRHGIVVVEVKGGRVEIVDGRWYTTDRHDERFEIKDPFRQATDSKHALLTYLRSLGVLAAVPRLCHVVALPDLTVLAPIGLNPREIVWDGADIHDMPAVLRRLLDHWEQSDSSSLSNTEVGALVRRLSPTTTVTRRLRTDVADSEADLIRLTDQQIAVFRTLRLIRRCVIEGGAGTGKTILAMEKARRLAEDGARVLLTCFNAPLAERVARDFQQTTNVTVSTFHALCGRLARQCGVAMPRSADDNWFDTRAADILTECLTRSDCPRFDALIVDEAQDFVDDWIAALLLLLTSPSDAPVCLFLDNHQQIFRAGRRIQLDWPVFPLDRNCRNTLPIAKAVSHVFNDPLPTEGAEGALPSFLKGTDRLAALVQSVVERMLTEEGLTPEQIAVLSDSREVVDRLHKLLVGDCAFVPLGGTGVLAETIHRFKGLEAAVVVLALSTQFGRSAGRDDALLYVGASRARSMLMIVGPASVQRRLGLR